MPTITVTNTSGALATAPITGSYWAGIGVDGSYGIGASKTASLDLELYEEFMAAMAAGIGAGNWEVEATDAVWPLFVQSEHTVIGPVAATGSVTCLDGAAILDGETLTIDDGTNAPTVFEFDSGGGVGGGNVAVVFSAGVAATGSITAVAGAALVDGEVFTLRDGVSAPRVFEFDSNAAVVDGHYAVTFAGGDAVGAVRDAIISAINNATPSIGITASIGGADTVTLTNDVVGTAGNTSQSETVVNGGFAITNMTGGAAVTSATAMNTALRNAINGVIAGLTVTASDGGGALCLLANDTASADGNVALATTVADPGFLLTGMTGGVTGDPSTVTAPANVIGRGYTPLLLNAAVMGAGAVGARTQTILHVDDAGGGGISLDSYDEATGVLTYTNLTAPPVSDLNLYVTWAKVTV